MQKLICASLSLGTNNFHEFTTSIGWVPKIAWALILLTCKNTFTWYIFLHANKRNINLKIEISIERLQLLLFRQCWQSSPGQPKIDWCNQSLQVNSHSWTCPAQVWCPSRCNELYGSQFFSFGSISTGGRRTSIEPIKWTSMLVRSITHQIVIFTRTKPLQCAAWLAVLWGNYYVVTRLTHWYDIYLGQR